MADENHSAHFDLNILLTQIDQASDHSRKAVGSATNYIKTIQYQLKNKLKDVRAYVDLGNTPFPEADFFRVLEWDGKRIQVVTGIAGDDPSDFSYTAALELPGIDRMEIAERIPELIQALVKAAKERADKFSVLADSIAEKDNDDQGKRGEK